jgi:DNA polymerase III subunit epsilon
MHRQIILDTETTGLIPTDGHKLIEIGGIEMVNRRFTGRHFHRYLNPQRPVDPGAFAVHGLSDAFLRDKPLFSETVEEFLAFIGESELIIHNAPFDLGFLNEELRRLGHALKKIEQRCTVIDTLLLARKKHPGQSNSLDALCRRYQVDNSNRDLHGALIDAQLLGRVYLAMTGGQEQLFTDDESNTLSSAAVAETASTAPVTQSRPASLLVIEPTESERQAHLDFLASLKKI